MNLCLSSQYTCAALTAGQRLHGLLLTAALEALLHHHVEVGKDDEGEGDVEAVAVLLHQEIPLELPDLVVVLLDGAHSVAGGGDKVKLSFRVPVIHCQTLAFTAEHGIVDSSP